MGEALAGEMHIITEGRTAGAALTRGITGALQGEREKRRTHHKGTKITPRDTEKPGSSVQKTKAEETKEKGKEKGMNVSSALLAFLPF